MAVAAASPHGGLCGQQGGVWPGKGLLSRGNLLGGNLFSGSNYGSGFELPLSSDIAQIGLINGGGFDDSMISGYSTGGLLGGLGSDIIIQRPAVQEIEVLAAPSFAHSYAPSTYAQSFAPSTYGQSFSPSTYTQSFAPNYAPTFSSSYVPSLPLTHTHNQPCHQRVQVPVKSFINEQIDVPVEIVENIPVAEESADYLKDEREFKADAHAYEQGHSQYQRWENAEALDRDTNERARVRGYAGSVPSTHIEHQKINVPVEVEEMVEVDIEVPQVHYQPTCGHSHILPYPTASTYLVEDQPQIILPQTLRSSPCNSGLPLGLRHGLTGLTGLSGLSTPCRHTRPCGCRL